MGPLADFIDVLLRGLALLGLSAAVGGVVFALAVLRPLGVLPPLGQSAVLRVLSLIRAGSGGLAISTGLLILALHPWTLADDLGRWPIREFLATDFGRAGLVRMALALSLVLAAGVLARGPDRLVAWLGAAFLSALLVVNAAWLTHAVSRLDARVSLMAATVVHLAGASVWTGGIMSLAGFWFLARRLPGAEILGPPLLARFSSLAILAMALVLGPGLVLSWQYVGEWGGLIGTGYGVMVLTKVALFATALIFGGLNFVLARQGSGGHSRDLLRRVPALIEVEVGLGAILLLCAASLTSLPPAVDALDRATMSEIAARFVPRAPRLTSPDPGHLLAAAAPISDTLATRQPEESAWSEYNHHVAGLLVALMGLLTILERTGRVRGARHWPLLLLALAAFVFVRGDPRAWPLGPAGFWETMLLPDVLQHRLLVALMVALALFEWRVRVGRPESPRWRLVFPALCAAGGALLLTHSHAMFDLRREFLAEVSHAPMGILAVFLGWGRWLELRLPEPDGRMPGWVWSISMLAIGAILLVYQET